MHVLIYKCKYIEKINSGHLYWEKKLEFGVQGGLLLYLQYLNFYIETIFMYLLGNEKMYGSL